MSTSDDDEIPAATPESEAFGRRLTRWLAVAQISKAEAARRAGVSLSSLQRLARGEAVGPDVTERVRLLIIGESPDDLPPSQADIDAAVRLLLRAGYTLTGPSPERRSRR